MAGEEENQYFESLRQLEHIDRVQAALGYQGLAMRTSDPSMAEVYFDASMQALRAEDEKESLMRSSVLGRALLNLAPVIRDVVVDTTISNPGVLLESYTNFIKDLGKQARADKVLVEGPVPKDQVLAMRQGVLIADFTSMAVLGLLMRFPLDRSQTNDWIALPAFLEPKSYRNGNLRPRNWHINIFIDDGPDGLRNTNKIYIRSNKWSRNQPPVDEQTSVVWVDNDLAVAGDKLPGIELAIIADLQSKTKHGQEKVKERLDNLLNIIDESTVRRLWNAVRYRR